MTPGHERYLSGLPDTGVKAGFSSTAGFRLKETAAVLLMAGLATGYVALARSPELQRTLRPEAVQALLDGLGPWGPVALVGAMAAAIVFSPVPSAPLSLAAGALYGHMWGTIYALVGAEIGALIAFGIARALGRPFVARIVPGDLLDDERWSGHSEWLLAGTVLVSRLFPFISFDAVSYLAGLTRLRLSLFAGATFIGMIPMTFLFSHLGGAMTADEEPLRLLNLLALLGLAGLIWIGWRLRRGGRRERRG
ncbi:MAG: TVP38/TMEM64 family protein [Gemmatimonadetes bacterium]|nr:TVP38/TMEM64 family protein [Gemmatimonadota bacterium]NIU31762.1 TVP38/TMEM64 family protein [Gemmatimonadota bacterium]NIW64840.1 TVP38/TMEM64 family protein [Gemmatimonadota bacterium]NIX40173.1 TVP38/TMEM64 family protein [Gemmatimonadota bacterium]